jgi:hypothetical protein
MQTDGRPILEELKLGAEAYRQVRLYDSSARQNRLASWLVPVTCVALAAFAFILSPDRPRNQDFLVVYFVLFALLMQKLWARREHRQVQQQRLLLELLKEKYGDQLPWVAEENQLATAARIDEAASQAHPA